MFGTTNKIIITNILGSIIPNHQPDYITIISLLYHYYNHYYQVMSIDPMAIPIAITIRSAALYRCGSASRGG